MTKRPVTRAVPLVGSRRLLPALAGAALCVLLLVGCAAAANPDAGQGADDAGFWLGLWQGFIAPVAFLVSLFVERVGIYEVRNSGGWYDFGFLIGLTVFFSGPAGASRGSRASKSGR